MIQMKLEAVGQEQPELSINITGTFQMIVLDRRIGYPQALAQLQVAAAKEGQCPAERYGDGEPMVYAGVVEAGMLKEEESLVVVMPTKYIDS